MLMKKSAKFKENPPNEKLRLHKRRKSAESGNKSAMLMKKSAKIQEQSAKRKFKASQKKHIRRIWA
ncbi:hypothetical protein [Ureibacillus sp. FSL K6-3587]|uniref:hypothetical protein n=1 Tax=Ureibacillus sp. FSL K6-3587 TaxID=2954681 RepID=UPI003158E9B3